jgi:hypothetical protein
MPKQAEYIPSAEEREAAEEDARNPIVAGGTEGKFSHELPEQLRPQVSERLSYESLLAMGLSDAEALLIVNTIRQKNGGMVEYDEDAEAERVAKIREQQQRLSRIDGGNSVQAQLSTMEAYFVGAIPRGDGKMCQRKPYMSPRDEKVWINGYRFEIPKHTRVVIPTEVIDLLEAAARARGDFDVVSAAFQARQSDPINLHEGVIPSPADLSDRALNYSYGDPFARR